MNAQLFDACMCGGIVSTLRTATAKEIGQPDKQLDEIGSHYCKCAKCGFESARFNNTILAMADFRRRQEGKKSKTPKR